MDVENILTLQPETGNQPMKISRSKPDLEARGMIEHVPGQGDQRLTFKG